MKMLQPHQKRGKEFIYKNVVFTFLLLHF